MKVKIKLNQW